MARGLQVQGVRLDGVARAPGPTGLAGIAIDDRGENQIFVAPGNAGTRLEPNTTNVDIAADDIPALLGLYREGQLKLDELISGRYALEEINEAVASTASGSALRNVIVFDMITSGM